MINPEEVCEAQVRMFGTAGGNHHYCWGIPSEAFRGADYMRLISVWNVFSYSVMWTETKSTVLTHRIFPDTIHPPQC